MIAKHGKWPCVLSRTLCVGCKLYMHIAYIGCAMHIVWRHVFWNISLTLLKTGDYIFWTRYLGCTGCIWCPDMLYIFNIYVVYIWYVLRCWCILNVWWTVYSLCILGREQIVYTHVYTNVTYIVWEFMNFEKSIKFMLENFQTQNKQLTKLSIIYALCVICVFYT